MVRFTAIASLCAAAAFATAASAQAPIVYASRDHAPAPAQSDPVDLLGGGEHSYGYGREPDARPQAAIDLRASDIAGSAEPAQRPDWLEQERVGPPYQANGRTYVPTPEPGYAEIGVASWYGPQFHGRPGANGEIFDQNALTAAHPTLPLNSMVQVTNLQNGRELIVRITDRGPFVRDRLIDLSLAGARALGFEDEGHARVHVRYLGPAPRRVPAQRDDARDPEPLPMPERGPVSLLPAASVAQSQLAPEAPRAPTLTSGTFVQIGAYSDLSNAHRAREQASAAGPVVIDVRASASGGELFRVSVGPLATSAEASATQSVLARLGFRETIIASR